MNYLIKMSQYPSFCYIFYLLHIYPSVDFLSKYFTTSLEEFFFKGIEKSFTFFMVKKSIKSNHNDLLFCSLESFWIKFLDSIVLSSLILCIRNSNIANEKRRFHNHNITIITFAKYVVLKFYQITCFTRFYGHISLAYY